MMVAVETEASVGAEKLVTITSQWQMGMDHFRCQYLRKSLDILQGGGGLMQQTGTSNSWTEDMVGTCICVSAYLRKGKFQRQQQDHKKTRKN